MRFSLVHLGSGTVRLKRRRLLEASCDDSLINAIQVLATLASIYLSHVCISAAHHDR